ncbi:MAG: hypothetical protein ACRD21_08170 [Vicinamibacteria bacterium]
MVTRSDNRDVDDASQGPGPEWRVMGWYQRFEHTVALILGGVIAGIIAISLVQLIRTVAALLVLRAFNDPWREPAASDERLAS